MIATKVMFHMSKIGLEHKLTSVYALAKPKIFSIYKNSESLLFGGQLEKEFGVANRKEK